MPELKFTPKNPDKMTTEHVSNIDNPPTVGRSSVMALVNYLLQQGASSDQIALHCDNLLVLIKDQDARVPLTTYTRLWDFAVSWTGNNALGLTLGMQQDFSAMGIVGHVVFNSENLRSGLAEYIRLFGVVNDAVSLNLSNDDNHGYLNFIHHYPEHYCIPDIERSLALALYRTRAWLGKSLPLTSVHFQHKPPTYHKQYQRVFACPVYFNQSECKIVFEKHYFEMQPRQTNPYLKTAALQYANNLLSMFRQRSLADRVRALIYREIDQHEPSIDKVSSRLNMSKQTLYRKLKIEGICFQQLVESVRFDKARQLLGQSTLNTSEIALMLGFSELSAFSRAFKRWSGMSPKEFRENLPA